MSNGIDPRIDRLQRQLLAIVRGGRWMDTWARINGIHGVTDLRGEMSRQSDADEVRSAIRAIDPNAATYDLWGRP